MSKKSEANKPSKPKPKKAGKVTAKAKKPAEAKKTTTAEKPAKASNPFLRKQFITPDKAVSVMATEPQKSAAPNSSAAKITQTVTHYEKISKHDVLEYFCEAIKNKLDMTGGGIKTFRYLYSKVQASIGLDAKKLSLHIDKSNCMQEAQYTSIQSVFNGINELIGKGIIAKSDKINVYFLNPNFFRPADFLIITEYYKVNAEETK